MDKSYIEFMEKLNQIIIENINKILLEREMKNSVPAEKIGELMRKYNFIPTSTEDNQTIIAYYDPKIQVTDTNNIHLSSDFNKLKTLVDKGGWTIANCGNHYDGMSYFYEKLQQYDSDINVGTFIVRIEPEYTTKMDDYFNEEYFENPDNYSEFDKDDTFDTKYQRGIFYHITQIQYLKQYIQQLLRVLKLQGKLYAFLYLVLYFLVILVFLL